MSEKPQVEATLKSGAKVLLVKPMYHTDGKLVAWLTESPLKETPIGFYTLVVLADFKEIPKDVLAAAMAHTPGKCEMVSPVVPINIPKYTPSPEEDHGDSVKTKTKEPPMCNADDDVLTVTEDNVPVHEDTPMNEGDSAPVTPPAPVAAEAVTGPVVAAPAAPPPVVPEAPKPVPAAEQNAVIKAALKDDPEAVATVVTASADYVRNQIKEPGPTHLVQQSPVAAKAETEAEKKTTKKGKKTMPDGTKPKRGRPFGAKTQNYRVKPGPKPKGYVPPPDAQKPKVAKPKVQPTVKKPVKPVAKAKIAAPIKEKVKSKAPVKAAKSLISAADRKAAEKAAKAAYAKIIADAAAKAARKKK